jgi:hypothetical protein
MPLNLYDRQEHRKYLTEGEREALLKAAEDGPREGSVNATVKAEPLNKVQKWLGRPT